MTTEIYQKITTASRGFEFTFQTEKVPHVDDKALDELVSCVEDSSPSLSDYESLDYTPPPSLTLHSLSVSASTSTLTIAPQENIKAMPCYSKHITDIPQENIEAKRHHVTDIPHASLQKKKTHTQATSSIRAVLEAANDATFGNPQGLLHFWKKGSQETVKEYWNRVQEERHDEDEEEAFAIKMRQNKRRNEKREAATLHKQRQRKHEKDAEIQSGVRSPGGTKRKVRY